MTAAGTRTPAAGPAVRTIRTAHGVRTVPARRRRATAEGRPASPLRLLRSRRRDRIIMQVLLIGLALWWLFPLYSAVKGSIQAGGFGNYRTLLTQPVGGVWLPRTFVNSAVIAVIHAAVVVATSAMAGFAFSRLRFFGREFYYSLVLVCLAVPATAILVPVYYITGQLGLFDSPLAVALPEATLTLPFGVLLLRNFADGLPESMFEAAEVDGASMWQVFRRIYLPQVRSPLINLAILCVMWSSQDFVFPSLVLNQASQTTASQAVETIKGAFAATPQQTSEYYAALVLLALPAVVLVTVGLRWISQGLSAGGSKE
jgi:raffinose/stachyose/melibiose transport system permease protein